MTATLDAPHTDAVRKAAKRAAEKDLKGRIPACKDPERRRRAEESTRAWLATYGPHYYRGVLRPQVAALIDDFDEIVQFGGDQAVAATRGIGKSTVIRWATVANVVRGVLTCVLIVGQNGTKAKQNMKNIKAIFTSSCEFKEDYPELWIPIKDVRGAAQKGQGQIFDGEHTEIEWGADQIVLPKIPGLKCSGAVIASLTIESGELRGFNHEEKRPQIVILDDPETRESAASDVLSKARETIIEDDIGGMGTPECPVARFMLTTIQNRGPCLSWAYTDPAQKPSWQGKRYAFLSRWPNRVDMWDTYVTMRQLEQRTGDRNARNAHKYVVDNFEEMHKGAVCECPEVFDKRVLKDGTQKEVSAVQRIYNEIADKGRKHVDTEWQNDPPTTDDLIESKLEIGHVMAAESDRPRGFAEESTTMIVRGVDVRKTELHFSAMASDGILPHRVIDYDVRAHGTSETTVEQAEHLIYVGLCRLADEWKQEGYPDVDGGVHFADLTLIDKGWMGSWTEDGEQKTWAAQPVEKFCIEKGLRKYLPAKGQPKYRQPETSRDVIIGDNWHINRGKGRERTCSEVIWNAEHWHSLVEGLFMVAEDDPHAFELFKAEPGLWANHKRLAEHMREGAEDLAELRKKATKTRKAKYRRDHFWDSFAMMLVARSVEMRLREIEDKRKPTRTLAEMAAGK